MQDLLSDLLLYTRNSYCRYCEYPKY